MIGGEKNSGLLTKEKDELSNICIDSVVFFCFCRFGFVLANLADLEFGLDMRKDFLGGGFNHFLFSPLPGK